MRPSNRFFLLWMVWGVGLFWAGMPASAATLNVPAGGDFQAALLNARPGDTIVLTAGAVYTTTSGFNLPNKGSATQMITIQSSALSSLPAAGYRVHPADAAKMPKLISTVNASPILQTDPSAHHYQFIGIEIGLASGMWSYTMVMLGDGTETSVSQLPHHITFDRCYVHADPSAQPGTKRGIQFNGSNLSVLNSYISDIHVVGQDAQAIAGANGPGPFTIVNNYLEAATENVLFGGSDPMIPNLVPSDIVVRNNYMSKPVSWYANDPSYAGIHWAVKNIFELKNAQRVTVDGNIFENCWQDGQDGYAVLITPRDQGSTAPWTVVRDVTFTHNIVRHSASGFQLLSDDNHPPGSQPTANITIQDNIIDDINPTRFGGIGVGFAFSRAGKTATNYVINHNTLLHNGDGNSFGTIGDSGIVVNQFKFINNLLTHGSYGFKGAGTGEGTDALDTFVTNYTMTKNVSIAGGRPQDYPAGNLFPAAASDVGFVNFKGGNGGDYHLTSSSSYKNAGTDGKDIGADVSTVLAATCGTIPGIPTSACSTYIPPPIVVPLPNPMLSLPAVLPVNARIQASMPGSYSIVTYNWSITPLSGSSNGAPPAILSRAASSNFSTGSGVADLSPRGLAPGRYQIGVTATDSSGQISPATQVSVTLVESDLGGVRVYPNPWRSDRHGNLRITFDRLTVNSSIKIFTVSGRWVTTLPTSSTSATWDLNDNDGHKVASGLYLYLIKADQGQKKTGKLAIIH